MKKVRICFTCFGILFVMGICAVQTHMIADINDAINYNELRLR